MARCSNVVVVALCALVACKREQPAPRASAAAERIPRVNGAVAIDGEWHEPDWGKLAARHQFVDATDALARPSSEVRLLHDDRDLFVGLYAGDEDIQSTDGFEVAVGGLALTVAVTGKLTPAIPGARVAVDHDGTLDNAADSDEEWVVELAIPLAAARLAPGQPAELRAARCDTPKDAIRRCGSWSGTLMLE